VLIHNGLLAPLPGRLMLVTALDPRIGYVRAVTIGKPALATNRWAFPRS
jgi:fumarate hydratase class II